MDADIAVCLTLTRAIGDSRTVEDIYGVALDALAEGLGVTRASILLFDADGVMRFKAYRQLSEHYRRAVEGHTPWRPDTPAPQPIVVTDVEAEPSLAAFLPVIRAEGIAAMAFIPLVCADRVIGKFMLYSERAREFSLDELALAGVIASQIAFAVERRRTEDQVRRSEERLRFALHAASMASWEWDLSTNRFEVSENFEALHGLLAGTLDGTFDSYERVLHPEDRGRVTATLLRASRESVAHDLEYRVVDAAGSVRWVENKGRVEADSGLARVTGVCIMATRRKEAELARFRAMEEAARQRDQFLATLSHELRTPLNAILGWVQLLQAEGYSSTHTRTAIEVIGRNATLQAQLIEDILDVSRIIAGKLELARLPVDPRQLIQAVIDNLAPQADAKHIEILEELPAELAVVEADPRRLQQVLGNVLSNAVKFTPDHGQIHVRCHINHGWCEIEVRDTGIGIAPEFLPSVFERFSQADSRSTRRHSGMGLGLAIARHLVERHHGDIQAASEGLGCGTTVTIRLPATVGDNARQSTKRPAADLTLGLQTSLHGQTVVVVDDEPDSRRLLASFFERLGATVVQSGAAPAALDALDRQPVALMVADLAMPDMDGYDLIRRVRDRRHSLPVVAVSAHARPEDRAQALAAGFNAYCSKPIDWAEFTAAIRQVQHNVANAGHPAF